MVSWEVVGVLCVVVGCRVYGDMSMGCVQAIVKVKYSEASNGYAIDVDNAVFDVFGLVSGVWLVWCVDIIAVGVFVFILSWRGFCRVWMWLGCVAAFVRCLRCSFDISVLCCDAFALRFPLWI